MNETKKIEVRATVNVSILSWNEVEEIIRSVKTGKALGPDGMVVKTIKIAGPVG